MLTGLNTIGSAQGFKDARYFFIKDPEGVEREIYLDTKGLPTIGTGFNLTQTVLDEVVKAFGFNLSSDTADIDARGLRMGR
jgi:GH24 family phage-related lysozyme (muramidase)